MEDANLIDGRGNSKRRVINYLNSITVWSPVAFNLYKIDIQCVHGEVHPVGEDFDL